MAAKRRFESLEGVKATKSVAVRFERLRYDPSTDIRDRNSPENKEWAENIYQVILNDGGITSTITGYKDTDENGESVIVIVEGRTRYLALKRAILEGKITQDHVDAHYIDVELLPNSNPFSRMKEQMISQYSKNLTPIEEFKGIEMMLALNGNDEDAVRQALGKTKPQLNAILKVGKLVPGIRTFVQEKRISLNNALEYCEEYKGDPSEMVLKLDSMLDAKAEQAEKKSKENNPSVPAASKKLTKREKDNDKFAEMTKAEIDGIKAECLDLFKEISNGSFDAMDGFELQESIKFMNRILNRIEKSSKRQS